MSRHVITRRHTLSVATIVGLAFVACADPGASSPVGVSRVAAEHAAFDHSATPGDPNSAKGDTKAFIGAWLNGEPVALRYTRLYYCGEPFGTSPSSVCEVGTAPEDFPRSGSIPKIYALAPAFSPPPDPSTIHCPGGVVCPNHPPTLDLPPLGDLATVVFAPAHSHIITERRAGWHNTVNIRVNSRIVWNLIVASPTLETVEALQASPLYGRANPPLISQSLPTNVFFFFEVHSAARAP